MPASSRRSRGWSRAHAERLLWRAGFGARPKEIEFWARRSRERTIDWLIRGGAGPHGTKRMVGPPPRANGKPLDPVNEWGHDMLWWLDKMVRSQRPLQEKLTLFWHDHFATRDQDAPLMLAQNHKLRQHALGPFPELLRAVTTDPAMQAFLSLVDSDKRDPNENYARELMELFTLGVTGGYTERDVREAARALTGFKGNYRDGRPLTISYDPERHDDGAKQLLGHRGKLDWQDVLRLVVGHRSHAPFLVGKLWDFFITEPLPAATRKRLARVYVRSHHRIAPVVREILDSRALYADLDRPQMVKWPIVQLAGQPAHGRARGRHRRLGVDQLDDGADALQPAERRRVGLGRGVDVDGHDARALPVRDVDLQGPPGEGDQGLGRPGVVGGRAGRARPRRHRAPVDEQRPPTASSRAWPSAS